MARAVGVTDLGIARAMPVGKEAVNQFRKWLADGCQGEMSYLEKYAEVRDDPRLLLDGAESLIVTAFNYYPARRQAPDRPQIAAYALGRDYHEVVRERLARLADAIKRQWGGATRVCVDTAPLRERYWAVRAGLGFIGRNSQLILPGRGSHFFIGTILSTVAFAPTEPCKLSCGDCGACLRACPTGALDGSGRMDARRCLSYLTIEYRGPLSRGLSLGNRLYGCDACQMVCPHNRNAVATGIPEFAPSDEILSLTREQIARMTPEEFSRLFRHSAIKRTKLSGLQRNLAHMSK